MSRISIEEALDDCLQRLPTEGLDACLRRYPQYAAELRGLLQLSMRVSRTGAATVLSNEARARMRAQLFKPTQATIANPVVPAAGAQPVRTIPLLPAARGSLFSRPLARAALVLLVLVALFIGGEVTSARALPGQVLYPVKRFYEGVRLTFSFNANDQATAHLDFANTRLDEIEDVFKQKGTIDASTLTDLAGNISYCTDQLKSSSFSNKQQLASALGAALQREQRVLESVSSAVATDARPLYKTAQDSIINDYQVATQFAPNLPPLTTPISTPTASPAVTPSPPGTATSPTAPAGSPTPAGAATATPAITNTPTTRPSATSTSRPKPSATPTRGAPQPRPSDTPLPAPPSPIPPHPQPLATSTPGRSKPPPTPTPTPTLTPTPTRTPISAVPSPPRTSIPQPVLTHPAATPRSATGGQG